MVAEPDDRDPLTGLYDRRTVSRRLDALSPAEHAGGIQRSRRRFREHSRLAIDQLIAAELRVLEQARDELIAGFQGCDPGPSPMKERILTVGLRYLAVSDPRPVRRAESSSPEWADVTLEEHRAGARRDSG
jgi:hypothetical protein